MTMFVFFCPRLTVFGAESYEYLRPIRAQKTTVPPVPRPPGYVESRVADGVAGNHDAAASAIPAPNPPLPPPRQPNGLILNGNSGLAGGRPGAPARSELDQCPIDGQRGCLFADQTVLNHRRPVFPLCPPAGRLHRRSRSPAGPSSRRRDRGARWHGHRPRRSAAALPRTSRRPDGG